MTTLVEQWASVPVPGYEDMYEVSSLGRMRKSSGRILRGSVSSLGYRYVDLHCQKVRHRAFVHRLMLTAFVRHGRHNNQSRSHCRAGHPFDESAVLFVRKSGDRAGRGYRLCRECAARRVACPACGKVLRRNTIPGHRRTTACQPAAKVAS